MREYFYGNKVYKTVEDVLKVIDENIAKNGTSIEYEWNQVKIVYPDNPSRIIDEYIEGRKVVLSKWINISLHGLQEKKLK